MDMWVLAPRLLSCNCTRHQLLCWCHHQLIFGNLKPCIIGMILLQNFCTRAGKDQPWICEYWHQGRSPLITRLHLLSSPPAGTSTSEPEKEGFMLATVYCHFQTSLPQTSHQRICQNHLFAVKTRVIIMHLALGQMLCRYGKWNLDGKKKPWQQNLAWG